MTISRIPSVEGGIQPTLLTAKGDLISATAASTVARLAVGSDAQILVADSTASTGLAWALPGFNLVYSGAFSAATAHTFDGVFTSTYDSYKVIVFLDAIAGGDTDIGFGLRSATPASVNYDTSTYQKQYATTVTSATSTTSLTAFAASAYPGLTSFSADVINPQSAKNTMTFVQSHAITSAGQPYRFTTAMYKYDTTSYPGCFVNSTSGNIGGTIRIYGYKD